LFETVAVFSARPCLWQHHLDRLFDGSTRLGIPTPTKAQLEADLERLLDGVQDGRARPWVFKIVLTRGTGGRGYRPDVHAEPLRISSLHSWPVIRPDDAPTDGLRLRTCSIRLGENPALAGLKHLCRLEQVMARREWSDPQIDEGLMLDQSGHVIEATSSNLFLQRDGALITPDLQGSGVAGVVRALILELGEQLDSPVRTQAVSLSELAQAEALYLSNSIAGIRRVSQWDGHVFDLAVPLPNVLASAMERIHSPC
jgi:4-amino-4-deoxychorismate lyase